MDKTALNEQAQKKRKISAKEAQEIRVSKQIASVLKHEWEELAKKQEQRGVKISAGRKISSITLTKNRRGKISVQVNMQNGARVLNNAREKNIVKFKEKAQKVYFRAKVEELLKKIKEYGYAAVEGEIPAELKEAVLKSMEKANISTSYKGEKAEAEAAREASQRAAEFADNALKNALHNSNSDATVAGQLAALWISPDLNNAKFHEKYNMTESAPPKQRRDNSSSSETDIILTLPDGSKLPIHLVGDNIETNKLKALASANALWRQENNFPPEAGDEALLTGLKKLGIVSLDTLQKNSNRMNNLKDKLIPEKYQPDLKENKKIDLQRQAQYKEITGKGQSRDSRISAPKVMIPLNLSVGRKIADITNDYRDHKKETSKEDKNQKALLTLYCKINNKDEITSEALKFSQDMTEKGISGNELWQKYKNEQKSPEEMKVYIAGRSSGKIPAPAPQKPRSSGMDKEKQKAADKAAKEALLAPDNAVSAEKIRQAKAVLDKEAEGAALSEKEQKLLGFVHLTFSKIPNLKPTDLEDPKNRKQLAAMLQCKKLYSNLPKEGKEVSKQTGKEKSAQKAAVEQKSSAAVSNIPNKQAQPAKSDMTEKDRVSSKIKENMEKYKASVGETKQAAEKQAAIKKNGLQQKLQKNQQGTKAPARPAAPSAAVQAALLKKKEEMSR